MDRGEVNHVVGVGSMDILIFVHYEVFMVLLESIVTNMNLS